MRQNFLASVAILGLSLAPSFLHAAIINEVRAQNSGTDDAEFIELFGTPGESLAGFSLIVLSSEFNPGLVDQFVDLGSFSLDSEGFLVIGDPGVASDPALELPTINNSDALFTPANFMLVSGPTGGIAADDDLDADDDGVFDVAPAFTVEDNYFAGDADGNPDFNFLGGTELPVDGTFAAAGFYLDSITGDVVLHDFGDLSLDTPGAINVTAVPEPGSIAALLLFGTAGALRRRRR